LEPAYRQALATEVKLRTSEQKKLAEHAEILTRVTWDEILAALPPAVRAERATYRERIHALAALMPAQPAQAWTIRDAGKVPQTHLLQRGDPQRKGPEVVPAFPRVLVSDAAIGSSPAARLDRVALARWLTAPDHPLTARVMVNRVWQHHFGRGLVETPNDFGLRGAACSHAELLDWLAGDFVLAGWSIKHLHRRIVLSNTYRQSSKPSDNAAGPKKDPANRLLWRMNRQRLEGEILRDCVLSVSGSLYAKLGGPMVRVPIEREVYDLIFTEGEPDGLWPVTPDLHEHGRRTIYLFAKRNVRLPLLEAFDRPDTITSCPVRPVSTFAPQALILLNGSFMQEQSKKCAARLLRECGNDVDLLLDRAYRLVLSRGPRELELRAGRDFLLGQTELLQGRLRRRERVNLPPEVPEAVDPAKAAAACDFCLGLLNSNEFLYVK
jgi:hypothetical protein